MEISIKNLFIAFMLTIGFSLFMIFFVFISTVYTFLDVFLLILIASAIFLGSVMLQYQLFWASYPLFVVIFERRADSYAVTLDKGKRIASPEAGKFSFHLKQKKVHTKPIDYKFIYPGAKGGNYLFLYMPQHNEFVALKKDEAKKMMINLGASLEGIGMEEVDKHKMITTPENARYWYSEQLRRNAERWGKKFGFEKYANIIQFALIGFVMGFILYIFLGQMQGVIAQIGGITSAQAELTKEITRLLAQTGLSGSPGIPPSPII